MDEPAAVPASTHTLRTLVDGTVELRIHFHPKDRDSALKLFGEPGLGIAVARLTAQASKDSLQWSQRHPYGNEAKALKLSGFFRNPEVWRAIGSDEEFIEWVQRQPSCHSDEYSEYVNGEARSIAHHVRRADESGTGHKGSYCCVPLTQAEHEQLHRGGERSLGRTPEWFDQQRIKHVERWAWSQLRESLGYESMGDIPPHVIAGWATFNGADRYLPEAYRGATSPGDG